MARLHRRWIMQVNPCVTAYNITTISGKSLLKHYSVKSENGLSDICFEMNFADSREVRRYVKATDLYKDTAMFYQIRKILDKDGIDNWNEDSLRKVLFFVDFETIFNKLQEGTPREYGDSYSLEDLSVSSKVISDEYRVRKLFDNGIIIKYEDGTTINYVPFDKSNSMSRQSKMSFIDKSLLNELNKRLNMGLTFKGQMVNLSKYYAYRGLYLSTADRVPIAERIFTSDTVIVIKDTAVKKEKQHIITAEPDDENCRKWHTVEKEESFPIDKVFDGEGIISPSYTKMINKACNYGGATSFQVRMPFIKGMLHEVDFHSFIKEMLGDVESFYIEDVFGVKRDLLKAEIIMPESMFKCKKWIENELNDSSICMDYYFNKFYELEHALYISNTNLIYGNSSITKLNYQFLNTLALECEEFDSLMKEHVNWVKNPIEYMKNMEESSANNDEAEIESLESVNYSGELWKYALDINPIFSHESKINNVLKMVSEGLKQDCARGKIIVKGEIRFLSRDLLAFLIDLIKDGADESVLNGLMRQCMFEDEFFMPGSLINLEKSRHYPIFRNPHLSRNEQCVLKPYIKGKKKAKSDLYYRYLSHLTGVIMVAYQSLIPATLGGADFDGDIVKIIDDARIRNAVLRGTYESYNRKLPIIVIPSAGGTKLDVVSDKVSYDVIKDTFSNKVGQISNLSIRLGNREYGSGEHLEHSCVECTILTGLEIDAAKTGEHPDLSEIMEYGKDIRDKFDYVSSFKEKIDEYSSTGFGITPNQVNCQNGKYQIKQHSYDQDSIVEYIYNDEYRNLNKIPKYYFDIISEKTCLPGSDKKVGGRYIYFDFLENNDWKKSINTELQGKLGAIMAAYYQIEKISSKLSKYRKYVSSSNYEGYVRTILLMQYDYEDYEEKVNDELSKIWAFIDANFDTIEKIEVAIKKITESDWPFLLDKQKGKVLCDILGYKNEEDMAALLSNFDAQGYNLLFYVLKDVWVLRSKEMTDQEALEKEITEDESIMNNKKVDSDYYGAFYAQLYQKYVSWRDENLSHWKKKLREVCNEAISELLSDIDEDQRLYLLYSLRGSSGPDKNSMFFWDNITVDDIKKHANRGEINVK